MQVNHINSEDSIVQGDHSNHNEADSQSQFKDRDNSLDESHGESDSSQQ